MSWTQKYVLLMILSLIILISCFVIFLKTGTSNKGPVKFNILSAYEFGSNSSSVPVSRDNILVFALRINDISSSLNKAIKQGNLNIRPVRFDELNRSCGEFNSWYYDDDYLTIIYLCRDLSNLLTKDEVVAYSVHELCHILLGHNDKNVPRTSNKQRNIEEEIDADYCAVESKVDPVILTEAIRKLASDDPWINEKNRRILFLEKLIFSRS